MYTPSMTKNLISVATIDDKGYIVNFVEAKVYIQPKNSRTIKVIRVRKGNLSKLQF